MQLQFPASGLLRINRNIMECKGFQIVIESAGNISINRNIMECKVIPFHTVEERSKTDADKAEALLSQAMEGFHKKLVVLDDDPTGVQTVHDVSVYTDWEEESIRKGFEEKESMFFILTNSRSFSVEETTRVHLDIAARVAKVARELGQDFMIISRGDSTLRGHYPLETQLLAEGLADGNTAGPEKTAADNGASAGSTAVDGEIICPFFPEGGRYTMDNIHYVKEQDNLVPAGMTEFARDKTFGYKSSDLTEYVEEKTEGKYHKEDCITISLDELNALDVQGIKEKLMSAQNMAKIIVNAVSYADLKVFCAALVLAMKEGKHYMARTAAAFTKVMGRISDQPLLGREQLEGDTKNGGIVLIGSHVKKTTDQLNCLKELDGQADFMEFQVNTVFEENGLEKEVERTVKAAEEKRLRGWSFGFRKPREERAEENGMSIRKISDLELTEVSIIDNKMKPWYNSTTIEARAEGENEIEVRAQEDDLDYISNKKPENDAEKSRAKIKKMIEEAGGNI